MEIINRNMFYFYQQSLIGVVLYNDEAGIKERINSQISQ